MQLAERVLGIYPTRRLRFQLKAWETKQRKKELFLVYAMPKVGSMSMVHTIAATDPGGQMWIQRPVFLSEQGLREEQDRLVNWFGGPERIGARWQRRNADGIALARHVRAQVANGQRFRIVTLVRDPVATDVSGFFHNSFWWPDTLKRACRQSDSIPLQELRELFLTRYWHDLTLDWFTMELKAVFDIDVFARPFPVERGYSLYGNDKADVLLLRLEDSGRILNDALEEFLGVPNITPVKSNLSQDKWYSRAYRQFVSDVSLPPAYLQRMYGSQLATHFYTGEEISAARRRWDEAPALTAQQREATNIA